LKVSVLGFGTGGPSSLGQSSGMPQNGQTDLIRRCFDVGINFFDTSSLYGKSEEILGRGLKGVPRDSYVLSTKWGHATTWSPRGVGGKDGPLVEDPQALIRGVEGSLGRLGTDYIDILHFHGLRPEQYHEVVERFCPGIERLQQEGKVRFLGFTTRFIADPVHEAALLGLRTDPDLWDTVMLKYGILNQVAANEVLPLALKHGTGVINMAAVRIKLPRSDQLEALIADWKRRGLVPADSLPDKNPLGWLVHDDVDSVVSAGYKFAADHPAISTVLTGTANPVHLEENAAALEKPSLAESDRQRLVDLFGQIAEYA
jgi:L-galactose dehydrogenase